MPAPAHQPFSSNSLDLSAPEEAYSRNARASVSLKFGFEGIFNKVNRKVKGMPQSKTATNPRHQEEEKRDKNIHAQNKQTNVREAQKPAPSSSSEMIKMLK